MGLYYEELMRIAQAAVALRELQLGGYTLREEVRVAAIAHAEEMLDDAIADAVEAGAI